MRKRVHVVGLCFAVFVLLSAGVMADSSKVSVSLVNQDPDPAYAGDVVELRLGVENRGDSTVSNLILELVPEYPYEPITGEALTKSIATLGAFQYDDDVQVIRFKLRINRDALAGAYPLKVNYHEQGESALKQSSLSVQVESKKNAEVIFIDKFEIVPGEITPLTFTINNVGSAPLREISFHWANEEGVLLPVGSDDTRYIKYIDVGQSEQLVYNVIASSSAEPDLYKLSLELTYDDPLSDTDAKITTMAGVYVGGQTDFDVAFSGNSQGEMSFSVSNIGSVPASSVTVSIPKQPGWQVSGSNSAIIGNLDKGDYTVASFTLQMQDSQNAQPDPSRHSQNQRGPTRQMNASSASNALQVQIAYTDSRGQRHTLTKEVMMDPTSTRAQSFPGANGRESNDGSGSKTLWLLILLVLLIGGWLIHKTYKKRKFDDPKYTYKRMFTETVNYFKK